MESLLKALETGATVLTATRRLAREIQRQYAERQRSRGQRAWQTPRCHAFGDWLKRVWAGGWLEYDEVLLSGAQERLLWEEIIAVSPQSGAIAEPAGAARLAAEAWRLVQAYRIPLDDPAWSVIADGAAFRDWAGEFSAFCGHRRLLSEALLPDRIADFVKAGRLKAPGRIVLAGFDELPPQYEQLLKALVSAGCRVEQEPLVNPAGRVHVLGLIDANVELEAAARWLRMRLEADSGVRLAVVAPDLAAVRPRLEAVFDEVLDPASILPGHPRTPVYNVSLGGALADFPLVRDALLALELARRRLPLEAAGALLRSPFFTGAAEEQGPRALLDARLRERGELVVRLRLLLRLAAGKDGRTPPCPLLARLLARFEEARAALPLRQPPSAWCAAFTDLLLALGWPGERAQDSAEYQTLKAWLELLEDFAALELLRPALDLDAALTQLARLAGERLFQPETPEVPVQVLGALEATGLGFSAVWVMGLNDETLPGTPRPNPLIPIALARRHDLPHATPQRVLAEARQKLARLTGAAPEVILSYPQAEGDRVLQPSALLHDFEEASAESLLPQPIVNYRRAWLNGAKERIVDFTAPTLPAGARVAGGARLFQDQAACPFRAFAKHRLSARGLEHPDVGLDPMARGRLIHALLELVWQELKDQQGLNAQSPEMLHAVVEARAQDLVAKLARTRPSVFTPRFAALEKARIVSLALQLLELDRARPPFAVETERRHDVRLADLELSMRIDRIDRLPDGRCIIIDYKTGDVKIKDWLDGRPDEPQLPLYAYATGQQPAALLFASLKTGAVGYVGLAQEAGLVPGVKTVAEEPAARAHGDWHGLYTFWGRVLYRLAKEFRDGRAEVDPKHVRDTCRRCDLGVLCRVSELRGEAVETGIEEEVDD